MRTAIVTGASRGLGLELARALADRGWRLVIDARAAPSLEAARAELAATHRRRRDRRRRRRLRAPRRAASRPPGGRLDLLVNNASTLGADAAAGARRLPARRRSGASSGSTSVAPLALVQLALPRLPAGGRIVNVTSDAAVEAYEGWGGYGASKAALEQLSAVLAAERPDLRVYAVDPGDMRTRMHQDAFPGEDISDRPPPATASRACSRSIEGELPSGRYRARRAAPPRSAHERRARRRLAARRAAREAHEPPEARGLPRDEVRMLVADGDGARTHARARDLPGTCAPATCSSSTPRRRCPPRCRRAAPDGDARSTCTSRRPTPGDGAGRWLVELRRDGAALRRRPRRRDARPAGRRAADAARALLAGAPAVARRARHRRPRAARLPRPPRRADPLRPHRRERPLADYQTVFALQPGSAEMPSAGAPVHARAGRARSSRAASSIAPLVLHTGVSSLEAGERPTPSATPCPPTTARLVNAARAGGGRVIAVGTTVVRALETVALPAGTSRPTRAGPPRRHARARRARRSTAC